MQTIGRVAKSLCVLRSIALLGLSFCALTACATGRDYLGITLAAEAEPTELQALASRAQQGDASAQYDLSLRFRDGIGVPKDASKADMYLTLSRIVRPSLVFEPQPTASPNGSGGVIAEDVGGLGEAAATPQSGPTQIQQPVEYREKILSSPYLNVTLRQLIAIVAKKPKILKAEDAENLFQTLVTEAGDGEGISKKMSARVLAGTYTRAVARQDSFDTLIHESVCPQGCVGHQLLLVAGHHFGGYPDSRELSLEIQYQYNDELNVLRLSEVETRLAPLGYRLSAIRSGQRDHYGGQWELAAFKGPKNSVPIVAMYNRGQYPMDEEHSKIAVAKVLFVFPIGE